MQDIDQLRKSVVETAIANPFWSAVVFSALAPLGAVAVSWIGPADAYRILVSSYIVVVPATTFALVLYRCCADLRMRGRRTVRRIRRKLKLQPQTMKRRKRQLTDREWTTTWALSLSTVLLWLILFTESSQLIPIASIFLLATLLLTLFRSRKVGRLMPLIIFITLIGTSVFLAAMYLNGRTELAASSLGDQIVRTTAAIDWYHKIDSDNHVMHHELSNITDTFIDPHLTSGELNAYAASRLPEAIAKGHGIVGMWTFFILMAGLAVVCMSWWVEAQGGRRRPWAMSGFQSIALSAVLMAVSIVLPMKEEAIAPSNPLLAIAASWSLPTSIIQSSVKVVTTDPQPVRVTSTSDVVLRPRIEVSQFESDLIRLRESVLQVAQPGHGGELVIPIYMVGPEFPVANEVREIAQSLRSINRVIGEVND